MSEEILNKTYEEVVALKDLFLRRLMDDKVKMAALVQLKEQNEILQKKMDDKNLVSFVNELLLVCDRVERQETIDDLTESIKSEILDILERRKIYQMEKPEMFNPALHRAVGAVPVSAEVPEDSIVKVVRKGYYFRDQVLRPADVIVASSRVGSKDCE